MSDMREVLTLWPTVGIITVMLAALIGLTILEKRPLEFGKTRWPTTPFFFLVLLVIVVMGAHLLTLFGMGHAPRY
ncbi:MAG: hypothetical protein ACOH12_09555 [Parvibaculaceae bacterium]